jgi:hypothetical protein
MSRRASRLARKFRPASPPSLSLSAVGLAPVRSHNQTRSTTKIGMAKKTSPTLASGNAFEYYIPKVAGGAKPTPVPSGKGPGGKPKYSKPRSFIDGEFQATTNAPFGSKGTLSGNNIIQDIEVIRAALESGYGRRSNWTAALLLSPSEALGLTNYLLMRLEMVASCIELDGAQARVASSFYERIEPSEKVALSFILGGIGAYLAARHWLEAAGDSISDFLHVGIFTKGIKGTASHVHFMPSSGKWPDYLVHTRNGDWHVFESKGGTLGSRWGRLVEGLLQLQHVPPVAWSGKTPKTVATCVCAHTSVDARKRLHVTAIDPPGGDVSDTKSPSLFLFQGACRLLAILEAIEQFRALVDLQETADARDDASQIWSVGTSVRFRGLVVGVPKRYLLRERTVRRRMAVFLAVREAIEELGFNATPHLDAGNLALRVRQRLIPAQPEARESRATATQALRLLSRAPRKPADATLLETCSQWLKLDEEANALRPTPSELTFLRLTETQPVQMTSAGMLLQQTAPGRLSVDVTALIEVGPRNRA